VSAPAGKCRVFDVTIVSAPEATAAASACRSAGSLVIVDSRDAMAASGTSASANARLITSTRFLAPFGCRPTVLDEHAGYLIKDSLAPADLVEVLLSGARPAHVGLRDLLDMGTEWKESP
jgi:hypothetical protein